MIPPPHSLPLTFTEAVLDVSEGILIKLLSNVLADPADEKKRSVRLENPKIKQAVVAPRGAMDLMVAAGFVQRDGLLVLEGSDISKVQTALAELQEAAAQRAHKKATKDDLARQKYLDEVKQKNKEAEKRRAEAKAKISGQRKEEKTYVNSVSQHQGFGAGEKQSATNLGAGGDDKGG